jgi:hypothetical protein
MHSLFPCPLTDLTIHIRSQTEALEPKAVCPALALLLPVPDSEDIEYWVHVGQYQDPEGPVLFETSVSHLLKKKGIRSASRVIANRT